MDEKVTMKFFCPTCKKRHEYVVFKVLAEALNEIRPGKANRLPCEECDSKKSG